MAFLDHIRFCNAHDLKDFVPFRVGQARVGLMRRSLSLELRRFGSLFHVFEDLVHLGEKRGDLGLERTVKRLVRRAQMIGQALESVEGHLHVLETFFTWWGTSCNARGGSLPNIDVCVVLQHRYSH